MKVVAGDVGNYEREEWVESVVIAPAERYVVHVRFDQPGDVALVNRVRGLDHLYGRFFSEDDTLGVVHVVDARHAARTARRRSRRCAPIRAASRDIAPYRRHFARRRTRRSCSRWRRRAPVLHPADHAARLDLLHAGRVERHHAGNELGRDRRPGAVDPSRPGDRQGEHGHRLELPTRRCREDPARERARGRSTACSTRFTSTASGFSCSR